jgi:LmbE family N-acetylglucosaminyl deacetylase
MQYLLRLVAIMCLVVNADLPCWAEPQASASGDNKLRVVVFGGHPDDPESGCGGLIALLTANGHEVIVGYATCFRGDRTIGTEGEGVVRRREATAACEILGAKPHFFDYAHEKLQADEATLRAVDDWLKELRPDVVVTHWPLDTHPNHHVTSSLIWQTYLRQRSWSLYAFEVMTDQQTQIFRPELYLDIESVREVKRRALECHQSQKPDAIWTAHEAMHRRRGQECGVEHAEAFTLLGQPEGCHLLPLSFMPATLVTGNERAAVPARQPSVFDKRSTKTSLSFPRNSFEASLKLLGDDIGIEIVILVKDLQDEGITKNQSFGLDARDRPADQILRKILKLADRHGRLVYIIKAKETDGKNVVYITTRAAVKKRGEKPPP